MKFKTVYLLFLIFISSCFPTSDGVTTPNTVTPTSYSTANIPIFTPTSIASSTVQPSMPTLPIFTSENASLIVKDLLENNGGCDLPCWWGIVPGETHWDEAERFLSNLSLKIDVTRDETTIEADGSSARAESLIFM